MYSNFLALYVDGTANGSPDAVGADAFALAIFARRFASRSALACALAILSAVQFFHS
jgi:hypothetical protein